MRKQVLSFIFVNTLCICYTPLPAVAQSYAPCTDSVRRYLCSQYPDTGKVSLLLRLTTFNDCPPDTMLVYGQQWEKIAGVHHSSSGMPEAAYLNGYAWWRKGHNQKAVANLYAAARYWELNHNNPLQLARTYELVATVHKSLLQYEEALRYYRKAYQLKLLQQNPSVLLSTFNGLGNTFRALNQMDSALYYLEKALPLTAGNPLTAAMLSNNLGNIYWSLQNWRRAQQSYATALSCFELLQQQEGIAEACFNLGATATQLGKHEEAINYYKRSLRASDGNISLEHQEWIYRHLADAYFQTGKYSLAYDNAVKYADVKDSAVSLKMQQSVAALREQYEAEKREYELSAEQAKSIRLTLVNSNQRRLIYLLTTVAIVITLLGYLLLKNIRRKQRLAAELAILKEREKQQLIEEQSLRSSIAMLEGQHSERKRISRDLHDRLGSTLSSLRLFLNHTPQENSRVQDNKMATLLDHAITDLRHISHDLSDNVLRKYGLKDALTDLTETISEAGMQAKLYYDNIGPLTESIASEIYSIICELVNNTIRHSAAKTVSIQLTRMTDHICVIVEDDGKGFDVSKSAGGIGLHNVSIRAAKLHANLNLNSTPGNGTCISISIPVTSNTLTL